MERGTCGSRTTYDELEAADGRRDVVIVEQQPVILRLLVVVERLRVALPIVPIYVVAI